MESTVGILGFFSFIACIGVIVLGCVLISALDQIQALRDELKILKLSSIFRG